MKRFFFAAMILVLGTGISTRAQFRGPKADVATLVASDGVRAGTSIRAAVQVRLPETLHVQSNAPRDPSFIATALTVDPPAGVRVTEIVYPKAKDLVQEGLEEPLTVFDHEFAIGVVFDVASSATPGPIDVPAKLRYQACDERMCYAPANAEVRWSLRVVGGGERVTPQHADVLEAIAFGTGSAPPVLPFPAGGSEDPRVQVPRKDVDAGQTGGNELATLDRFAVLATTGGYLDSEDFLQFVRDAESGVQQKGLFEGRGFLAILLIVLVGGLALNLTPCVLPMIPINLAIIGAGAQAGSRARGFLLGSVYGGAMALVYGVLGLVVVLTAGTFGTINSSPWFNLAIAIVFVALALAMFDIITIDFSRYSAGLGTGGARGSLVLAFSMGAVAALLAGACVAPVVIQVVLFSSDLYAQGSAIALALPFLLGVGMAVPWPIAGAGMAALPKPGRWMVHVKQAFGVIILITAAYYGYQAYALFANRWVDPTAVASSVEAKLKEGWHASLAEGLAVAEREQKPVLLDMWATWCKNCLTMDSTTFRDPAVVKALDGYVKIKFQAEQPDEEPARALMQRFDAVGLPTYVILRPGSATAGS
jgi:cytochrome c biogenesis protein CcdA/DsbC/DsbD-like thiol-disulfide interchange protein